MIYTMFMDKMAPGILRLSVMDNDLDLFEGQYPVPQGVSYNSYLIEDDGRTQAGGMAGRA